MAAEVVAVFRSVFYSRGVLVLLLGLLYLNPIKYKVESGKFKYFETVSLKPLA
jgi:hypothetical protein